MFGGVILRKTRQRSLATLILLKKITELKEENELLKEQPVKSKQITAPSDDTTKIHGLMDYLTAEETAFRIRLEKGIDNARGLPSDIHGIQTGIEIYCAIDNLGRDNEERLNITV